MVGDGRAASTGHSSNVSGTWGALGAHLPHSHVCKHCGGWAAPGTPGTEHLSSEVKAAQSGLGAGVGLGVGAGQNIPSSPGPHPSQPTEPGSPHCPQLAENSKGPPRGLLGCGECRCRLRAVHGLEDPGDLQHDRSRLWVVHPLGAVQGVLEHVFKRCGDRARRNEPPPLHAHTCTHKQCVHSYAHTCTRAQCVRTQHMCTMRTHA